LNGTAGIQRSTKGPLSYAGAVPGATGGSMHHAGKRDYFQNAEIQAISKTPQFFTADSMILPLGEWQLIMTILVTAQPGIG